MKQVVLGMMLCVLLSACGYKGALYLPQEHDKQTFGVIQTGFGIDNRPSQVLPTEYNQPQPY